MTDNNKPFQATLSRETSRALDQIIDEAVSVVGAKAGYIRLVIDGKWMIGAVTELATEYLAEISELVLEPSNNAKVTLAAEAMFTLLPAVVDDVTTSEIIYPQTRRVAAKHGFGGSAAIPLQDGGQPIGVIIIFDGGVRLFTEEETSSLIPLACQAVRALGTLANLNSK
jgi:GAF domain-containing protein